MKKRIFGLLFLVAGGLLGVSFWGLMTSWRTDEAERQWSQKYTFFSPFANNGYWGAAAHGIMEADREYGTNTKCVSFSEAAARDIAEAILAAVYADTDGIIAWGEDSPEVEEAMQTAVARGIPLIFIDNDNPDVDRLCYIGTDNYEAGKMAGTDMCETDETLHIAAIIGNEQSENQILRLRGFQDEVAAHENCSVDLVMESSYSTLKVKEQLPVLLEKNPQINAIFCAEGYSSAITGEVLNAMGDAYDDVRVVVFDQSEEILRYIREGRYFSTIIQQSDQMGAEAVRVLHDWKEGKEPEGDILHTPTCSVRAENLSQAGGYNSGGVIWHLYSGNLKVLP